MRRRSLTYRAFQLALLQATVTCKEKAAGCADGTYGPPSPRRTETSPICNTDRLNRVDGPVANFSPTADYRGSREHLHLVERWTRLDANTLEYVVTVEDPTTWTRPWTVKQEMRRQDEQANRLYFEPRCHEGNYGLAGMFLNARAEERAFAIGLGPDPATRDNASAGGGGGDRPEPDPFEVAGSVR